MHVLAVTGGQRDPALPDVVQRIGTPGLVPGGRPPAEFAQVVHDDAGIDARTINDANIRLA